MDHSHDFHHDGAHHHHDFHHDVHHHGIGNHHSDIHHNIHHHPPVSSSTTGLRRPAVGNQGVASHAGGAICLAVCFGIFSLFFLTSGIMMTMFGLGGIRTVGIAFLITGATMLVLCTVLCVVCCCRKHQLQQQEQQAFVARQAGVVHSGVIQPTQPGAPAIIHPQGPGVTIVYGPGGQVAYQPQPAIQPSLQQYPATTPYPQQNPAASGPSEAPPAYEDVVKPASTPKEDGQVVSPRKHQPQPLQCGVRN